MSGPKARCPSCGTEWEGPVVFCGECGSPVAPADRTARLPQAPASADRSKRASTLVGALPGIPVSPNNAPPPPSAQPDPRRTTLGIPAARIDPAEGGRVPAITMVSPVSTTDRDTRPGKGSSGGKRRRANSTTDEAAPKSEAKPAPPPDDTPQIEVHAEAPPTPITAESPKAPAEPPVATASPVDAPVTTGSPVGAPQPPAEGEGRGSKPPARTSTVPPHDVEETARLLEDLDAGFESIVRPSAPVVWLGSGEPPGPDRASEPALSPEARAARHEADMAEVRALFAGIAVGYARPLRDFMIEVAWGEPTKEWLDVALPATQALRRAAAAVELPEVDAGLEGYMTALELGMGEGSIHREVREMLAGAYAKLIDAMPQVFSLEGELTRREPIIVRSLLLQVPGVRHVAIEKLYRAGINALDVFYAARPRELAEATGLDEATSAAICERFQRYKREVAETNPGEGRAKERAELESLTDTLAKAHEAHERAASSWGNGAAAERGRARKERADVLVRIDLLLAHLGEVDVQRTIAKVPFQQKIRELRSYLDEAKQRAAS